jgi:hypothetical protein
VSSGGQGVRPGLTKDLLESPFSRESSCWESGWEASRMPGLDKAICFGRAVFLVGFTFWSGLLD